MASIKTSVEQNKYGIKENRKDIDHNKTNIDELKSELRWKHESSQAVLERIIHRLIALVVVLVALLFISNAVWIYAWNTWDNPATTVINKDGVSNYIGGDGVIDNGEAH